MYSDGVRVGEESVWVERFPLVVMLLHGGEKNW